MEDMEEERLQGYQRQIKKKLSYQNKGIIEYLVLIFKYKIKKERIKYYTK